MMSGLPHSAAMKMEPDQRRHVRRTAWLLTLLAVGIYVAFVLYAMWRASH
jgi:hypothetical protein